MIRYTLLNYSILESTVFYAVVYYNKACLTIMGSVQCYTLDFDATLSCAKLAYQLYHSVACHVLCYVLLLLFYNT